MVYFYTAYNTLSRTSIVIYLYLLFCAADKYSRARNKGILDKTSPFEPRNFWFHVLSKRLEQCATVPMTPFSAQVLSLLNDGSQPAPAVDATGAQQASENGTAAGAVPLVGLGEWLLELLTSGHPIRSNVWLRRALVECPVGDIRRDFALLLSRAIRSLLRPTAARNATTAAPVPMQVSPPEESAAALTSTAPASKANEDAQNRIEVVFSYFCNRVSSSFYYS